MADAIRADPSDNREDLVRIANEIGLTGFLSLPVDNLPLYGTFHTSARKEPFTETNLKKMMYGTVERGHQLVDGAVTAIDSFKALENPKMLLKELNKADLLSGKERIDITSLGQKYVQRDIVGRPQEAALLKNTDLAILDSIRFEFRSFEDRLGRKLHESVQGSKNEVLQEIREVKLQVSELDEFDKITAKYVIETPSVLPIKFQIEIPVGEMSEDDLLLKVAELKSKTAKLPHAVVSQVKEAISGLQRVPSQIRKKLVES